MNNSIKLDKRDEWILDCHKFSVTKRGYAQANTRDLNNKRSTTFLHHFIIGRPLSDLVVDHKNGDTTDNRRSNLRVVSKSYNAINRKQRKDSKLRHKGVKKNRDKYRAVCGPSGETHLGVYNTQEEASRAYLRHMLATYGETYASNRGE